jgi:hypothetical protein
MNSAVSESPTPDRTDTIFVMGRLHDPAVFECAIAIIARSVEVGSRYLKRHQPRCRGTRETGLSRLAFSV